MKLHWSMEIYVTTRALLAIPAHSVPSRSEPDVRIENEGIEEVGNDICDDFEREGHTLIPNEDAFPSSAEENDEPVDVVVVFRCSNASQLSTFRQPPYEFISGD